MLKAVLLDLDNTMVIFNEPLFYQRYLEAVSRSFTDVMAAEDFSTHLLNAIGALRKNSGDMSNLAYFLNAFSDGTDMDSELIWERFEQFYRNVYDTIPVQASNPEGLVKTLDRLRQSEMKLVVATNPIFPLDVQIRRMAWVGIDQMPFDLITHIGNMSFVKPNLGYYRQICATIGLSPEQCLMVGNDPANDIVAGKAGLITYLTTDAAEVDYSSLTNKTKRPTTFDAEDAPDYTGPFARVISVVADLIK